MLRSALFFALLLIPACALAQKKQGQARLDSLLAEVPKMREDTNEVKLMGLVSGMYYNINPDEGLRWAEKELALAQKIGWQEGEASAYSDFGSNYLSKGAYPSALEVFFKALHIYEALGDKIGIGDTYNGVASVYVSQKDYPKALAWLFKSLTIAENIGNKQQLGNISGNIGNVYTEQGKNIEALEYQLKALHIAEELNNKMAIMGWLGNVGCTYVNLKQYNTALAFQFSALHIAEDMGLRQCIGMSQGNAGEAYYLIAKDTTAPKPDSLVPATRTANLIKAVEYLNKGIAACREIQFNSPIPGFSEDLSNALTLQGDYKGAMAAYKQSVAVKDSLYNTANNEKITNLETARAVELKDKDIQIAKLKKRNERILFAGGFAVLLLIMGILFRNFRKQQHTNQLLSKEKKRSDDLLLNILPAEVAEELKDSGASAAKQYDEVSVLFTDFVDFTGTAESLSPQALVKELNECFTAFDAIIERNGLEKIKTIGDAYMAVCGLPVSDPLHAKKTVQAAIEVRDFIEARKKRERAFEIRIGIHSGPVVAGIVGVKKFAYDIWGDTVNTAARMEQHGAAGRINISQSTYELVKSDYHCDYRGKIAAKNKGEVEMYFVEDVKVRPLA